MRGRLHQRLASGLAIALWSVAPENTGSPCQSIAPFAKPPENLVNDFGNYRSPLTFDDGSKVTSAADWKRRRVEIVEFWTSALGNCPVKQARVHIIEVTNRETFIQKRLRIEVARQSMAAYLLVPTNASRAPAVVIPFYEPQTSIGLGKSNLDFGYQLTKRGFVTLSIGSPGGDARKPEVTECQPLMFLGALAASCANVLAEMKEVDPKRIGVVGHSYGGKWAMFASCFHEKFACAVWCDPGIVFDESRPNVNYWEPWYLGRETNRSRKPGVPKPDNPRTGPYEKLFLAGRDLYEVHALMAPRPFLVSGGSEDPVERWQALNHTLAVYKLFGYTNRVAMTNRPTHSPTPESNEQIYSFLECWLKPYEKVP